jgi:hypothetical protein
MSSPTNGLIGSVIGAGNTFLKMASNGWASQAGVVILHTPHTSFLVIIIANIALAFLQNLKYKAYI